MACSINCHVEFFRLPGDQSSSYQGQFPASAMHWPVVNGTLLICFLNRPHIRFLIEFGQHGLDIGQGHLNFTSIMKLKDNNLSRTERLRSALDLLWLDCSRQRFTPSVDGRLAVETQQRYSRVYRQFLLLTTWDQHLFLLVQRCKIFSSFILRMDFRAQTHLEQRTMAFAAVSLPVRRPHPLKILPRHFVELTVASCLVSAEAG